LKNKWLAAVALASISILILPAFIGCERIIPTTVISSDNTSYAVTSRNGLRLTLKLTSTNYKSGDTVAIDIDETNVTGSHNNVAKSDSWPAQGLILGVSGGDHYSYYPFGVSILQGNYNAADAAPVTPLACFSFQGDFVYGLPELAFDSYDFQPHSNIAVLHEYFPDPAGPTSWPMNYALSCKGFWSGTFTDRIQNYFPPGTYTVVGGDEWGALAILHFTVS
jgi:hypothetical protein